MCKLCTPESVGRPAYEIQSPVRIDPYGFPLRPVWTSSDLGLLHILACRLQNMGHGATIDYVRTWTDVKLYALYVAVSPAFVDSLGYWWVKPDLQKMLENHGVSWDDFWSEEAANRQEAAWVANRPLYNE